jgi:hypothetical protein
MTDRNSLPNDTSPAAERVLVDIHRRMPAWRKVQLVDDANRMAAHLAMVGLRRRHPGESDARLRRRLLSLTLGAKLAERVYGPIDSVP